ncbi:MAG: threonine/serine dehydratase [Proteobacteria bacterium]|nr:threonine/serine dehydratase [Pseudomonadota bacterium]
MKSARADTVIAGMSRNSVVAAADRIAGLVRRTPVLRCDALDEIAAAELYLKAENLQYAGAFKARGAMHAVSRLGEDQRSRGIITYSSGNHAQAVARAARYFGIRADIAMPVNAPQVKIAAVRTLGGQITFAGTSSPERRKEALRIQSDTGAAIIEPFDHPDTIAGQGTATLEFVEELARDRAELDALVVPVGGGGLIAGACLATMGSATRIYSAEPVGCDALAQSMAAGERVAVEPGPTIADGLKPTRIGELNFAIAKERVSGCYTVDDDELGRALLVLLLRAKVLVEPSGAAALAVALRGDLPGRPGRVGVVLSGGNIAAGLVAELLEKYQDDLPALR